MRIKTEDLRMLMDYLEKELVEEVDVSIVEANFAAYVTFKDVESRECEITLYDSMREMLPDLTKKMQLHTRLQEDK